MDVGSYVKHSTVRRRAHIEDFRSVLAGTFSLNIPVVAANMTSVSGPALAAALAREGGLAFPPQMIRLEERVAMIEKIRRADSAFIDDPLKIGPEKTLREAKELMRRHNIWSLIVVEDGRPVGILSTRDWRYEDDDTKPVSVFMTKERSLLTARTDIEFDEARKILHKKRIEKLPLVTKTGKLAGLLTAHGLFYEKHYPRALRDKDGRFLAAASIGVGERVTKEQLSEIEAQLKAGATVLLIDTARAFSVNAEEMLVAVKKEFPGIPVVIGNTCSPQGAKFLFENGADAVKINQGRGSVCMTSNETPVGIGQLSAIARASVIARRYNGRIIADGGMKWGGDFVKAIIAGADVLMTGRLLVGTHESPNESHLNKDGVLVKDYSGSASFHEQQKRIREKTLDHRPKPEGKTDEVPVIGSVGDVVGWLLGSFGSAMSYYGVRTFPELRENVRFELQTKAARVEGTKEVDK